MSTEASAQGELSDVQLIDTLKRMKADTTALEQKINGLAQDEAEHKLVISALEKVEPTRQCHRLVGGVLIEKNAGDVLASLRENLKNLTAVIDDLSKTLSTKNEEMIQFATKYRLRFENIAAPKQEEKKAASTGVLV